MGYFLIILNQVFSKSESMLVRLHGKKYDAGWMLFNGIICLFSACFFVFTDKNGFYFPPRLFLFGGVSFIGYVMGFYGMYRALQTGSFTLSTIVVSFSCVFSVLYGIFALSEKFSITILVAIILMFTSIILLNSGKESSQGKVKITAKWLFFALLAMASNGITGIVARMQQIHFNNMCDNEFLIISLGGSFAVFMVMSIIFEKNSFKKIMESGLHYGVFAGLSNGAANVTSLAILSCMPISLSTPIKTGLSNIISFVISVVLLKEKFTKLQLLSVLLGIVSLILFKLS